MSPYREQAEMGLELPGLGMVGLPGFSLAPFGGSQPNCPLCTKWAPNPGKACLGERSFWTRTQLCPCHHPHFHPKCDYCGHVWLMAPRTGT